MPRQDTAGTNLLDNSTVGATLGVGFNFDDPLEVFGSPLQVLAFYLILLVLYFFLFLYFLGETLGDHYFSE